MSSELELLALKLEGRNAVERLAFLEKKLAQDRRSGFQPPETAEVNNHIHTMYSFSPYFPAEAAYGAWRAGLKAVGIVDHESVAGCLEMQEAGRRIGIAVTSGCELRVSAAGTIMEGRRINNPDSLGLFYMVIHGIPKKNLGKIDAYLAVIRRSRIARMREQVNILNSILAKAALPVLDFDCDVVPVSCIAEGGSLTERHILFALAKKIEAIFSRGMPLVHRIEKSLNVRIPPRIAEQLADSNNPHFLYDLLGLFKGALVPHFFQQPDSKECPPASEVTALASEMGAIPSYPYLGDVDESPTGDKRKEKYEDEWLDDLFNVLLDLGFKAITSMPPRNTREQLLRVKEKCGKKNFIEISGVDINSSRQNFRCPEIMQPEFAHLRTTTWALIAHEHLVSHGGFGLFDPASPIATAPLKTRIDRYASIGKQMDPFRPESIMEIAKKEALWTA